MFDSTIMYWNIPKDKRKAFKKEAKKQCKLSFGLGGNELCYGNNEDTSDIRSDYITYLGYRATKASIIAMVGISWLTGVVSKKAGDLI